MKTALLMLFFVTAGSPVLAEPYQAYQNSGQAVRVNLRTSTAKRSVLMWVRWVWCRPRRWRGPPG